MGHVLSNFIRCVCGEAEEEERPSERQNLLISPAISDSCSDLTNSGIDPCNESSTHGMVIDSSIQVVEVDMQVSPPFPDLNTREPREEDQSKEEDNEEENLIISKYDVMKERWIEYYSSSHKILLVGEADFSFSTSLAMAFGFATNMVATSLDSRDVVISNYKEAKSNLENLEKLGACVLHGVDATKMKLHTDLQMRKFDRIIYNFPHAGFHGKEDNVHKIKMHKNLVRGFFRNASGMLRANGEIHVNHKISKPFCHWNLEELASWNSLALIECVDFKREDYPGYNNKRGAGSRCDKPFPLGECSTFKFRFSPTAKKMFRAKNHQLGLTRRSEQLEEIPIPMQRPPTSLDLRYPQTNFTPNMNDVARYAGRHQRSASVMTALGSFMVF